MNVVRSTDIHRVIKRTKREGKKKSRAGGKDADDVGGRGWFTSSLFRGRGVVGCGMFLSVRYG